jgi:iron-sulfur cluster assembly accessory protein
MTVQTFIPENALTLTQSAIRHMESQVRENPAARGIRIGVKPSGCSGFMYVMDLVETPDPADMVLRISDQLSVFVDQASLPVLQGTELDYVKQGLNSTLQFRNPNTTSECGCGESFSVTK